MKPWLLLSLVSLTALTSQAEEKKSDPFAAVREAAKKFYTELRAEVIQGLPDDGQFKRLQPLITPELASLFPRAKAIQKRQMKEHPDDKPHWIEGDLFSSSFEGVTKWEIGSAFSAPECYGTVKVNLTYAEAGQKAVTWTDTLLFKEREGKWLLDDIRMGGEWAFKSGASLRHSLPGGGKDGQDHESLDERWKVSFKREGDTVTKITIAPAKDGAKAQVLFGSNGEKSSKPAWLVWSPDCDMIALSVGDDDMHTRTIIHRLVGDTWQPVKLPPFYPEERKTCLSNGFRQTDDLTNAEHWRDSRTLVVWHFASFTNGSDSDGWSKYLSVRVDERGSASMVEEFDTPGDN